MRNAERGNEDHGVDHDRSDECQCAAGESEHARGRDAVENGQSDDGGADGTEQHQPAQPTLDRIRLFVSRDRPRGVHRVLSGQ